MRTSTTVATLNWSSVKAPVAPNRFHYQEAMSTKGLIVIERNDTDPTEDHFHVIHENICVGTREDIDAARSLAQRFAMS